MGMRGKYMHSSEIICGLDIGGSEIRAVISNASQSILGFGQAATKGFSKSVVSNLAQLSDSIEASVMKAEEMAKVRVRKVITNVSGVHIRTFASRGSVHISDRPSEITKEDIKRCIESAKVIAMSLDREAVHLVPVRYFIDDKMEINDPLGLFGSKLDVDLNIITSLVTVLQNITKAVNLAGYEVDELVVSGAGAGLSVFEEGELQSGAVLIDAGKEITEASIFVDGRILDTFSFPFGGDDLTQILQDNLKILFDEAEEIKVKYGLVARDLSRIEDSQVRHKNGVITRSEIANLLLPKTEAALEEIYKKIEPFLKTKKSLPHISVVGGVAKMDGFIETVEGVFKAPVSMGSFKSQDKIGDITFTCALGLMKYGAKKSAYLKTGSNLAEPANFIGRIISRAKSIASDYF
ncbi:MAG: cell division protein FtsA [Candidatus Omnitrophota bacterium]|nr:cell division protein FtsA [Candidatus Omnitrophota bacterium]